jgi:uroporphyrinogen-III synthase
MRLLLTRTEQDNRLLAEMLAQKGHQPIFAPLLHIRQVPHQLPAGSPQDIILTSRHAVPVAASYHTARFYVVGEQTALGLRQNGCSHIVAEAPDAARLLPLLADDGRDYLYLSGKDIRCDFAQALNNSAVTRIVVYDAAAETTLQEDALHALQHGEVDGALFFSPRTAEIFHHLYPQTLSSMTAFCLSAAVAEVCESHGEWGNIIVADQPTLAAMLHAIEAK